METKSRRNVGKREVTQRDWMPLLRLYRACLRNAEALLAEARLLLTNGHHERAFAIAFTAYEEIGKSQVVADFFNDIVSKAEFTSAFRAHDLKVAYVRRKYIWDRDKATRVTVAYDPASARDEFRTRMAALYVSSRTDYEPIEPSQSVTRTDAEKMVEDVATWLKEIDVFECITERVGSKAFTK